MKTELRCVNKLLHLLFIVGIVGCNSSSDSGNKEKSNDTPLQYKVVLDTLTSLNNDTVCWIHARVGVISGKAFNHCDDNATIFVGSFGCF